MPYSTIQRPAVKHKIEYCRDIEDSMVVFTRDGCIISSRTNLKEINSASDIYSLFDKEEGEFLFNKCVSIDRKWLVLNSKIGVALVFTELYSVCGLLIAFFLREDGEEVVGAIRGNLRFLLSDDVENVKTNNNIMKSDVIDLIVNTFGTLSMMAEMITSGRELGEYIVARVASIADFVGVVGECVSDISTIPDFSDFSPLLFVITCALILNFARRYGRERSFKMKVSSQLDKLVFGFKIEVSDSFRIYVNKGIANSELSECDRLYEKRNAYFDMSLLDVDERRYLCISCIPQIPELDRLHVKENEEEMFKHFWDGESQGES